MRGHYKYTNYLYDNHLNCNKQTKPTNEQQSGFINEKKFWTKIYKIIFL